MTVRKDSEAIYLEGRCLAEDAEELLLALREHGAGLVDLGGALRLHLAVVQVLLALKPSLRGMPQGGSGADRLMQFLLK